MSADKGEFGQTVPPLSDYIRGILGRYPDGSQILKELLQNAEDADATVVKFLYDKSTWNTHTLFLPNLDCCQGHALCAYNDAEFQDIDWKGIQEPQRSQKSENVLKVGKFGIGFNSVYHITGMPWLLSGKRLVVMEPTEEVFSTEIRNKVRCRSGLQWLLDDENHQREILNAWDQFLPIEIAARTVHPQNMNFMTQWKYDGTLFRLPLRTKPCEKLSEVVYNDALVEKLFTDFAEDGAGLLLFLLNIEAIEASTREKDGRTQLHVAVKISSEDSKRVKRIKQYFSQKIKAIVDSRKREEKLLHCLKLNVHFGTEEIIINKRKQEKKWIVSHFLPSHSEAPRAWSIDVKRLPWVSLAAQAQVATNGRLFCFLPLPNNPEIVTGFPVHINAFFGVEDNRRNLKWSATDQTRDNDAQWNEALRDEVIPQAYVQLICYCRDQYDDESYSLWPKKSKVQERWKPLLEPFYKLLFRQCVLKVSSPSRRWIQFDDKPYIDILNKTFESRVADAVRRWLDRVGTSYVNAPDHVIEGVEEYSRLMNSRIQYLTPEIVRNELDQKYNWNNADSEDRLLLFHYFVTSKKPLDDFNVVAHLIQELPLIPLLNGRFGWLNTLPSKTVIYLASPKHAELLDSLKGFIINDSLLVEEDVQFLHKVADLKYGVEKINEKNFPTILRTALPDLWKNEKNFNCNLSAEQFPNRQWLQNLWTLLRQDYPRDLTQFVGLTLLELNQRGKYSNLIALPNQDKSLLFVQGVFLPNLEQLLIAADAIPLPNAFMQQHPALQEFIHTESTKSLITLLQNCNLQKLENAINANVTSRNELVSRLAQSIHEIPPNGKNIVSKLPLFEVWPKSSRHTSVAVSINNYPSSLAVNFDGLPANVLRDAPLMDCRSKECIILAQWLGIGFITEAEIAYDIIKKRNNYQANDFSNLMLWCMDHVKAWNVNSILKDFPFVQCDDGNYHAPSTIYDQTVEELKIFFSGELGKFPSGKYLSPKALEFLRGLGLKTTPNAITAEEMLQTAIAIDKLEFSETNKNNCFIQILQIHFNKLSKTQVTQMKTLKLFPAKSDAPKEYPNNLPWFGTGKETIYYPAINMAQEECVSIIGSVMPVVGKSFPQALLNGFGFLVPEDICSNLLVSHLKIISQHYQQMQVCNPMFQSMIHNLYKTMQKRDSSELKASVNNQHVKQWIWACNKFLETSQVVTKWNFFVHGLEPYIHSLPNFLQEESLQVFFNNMGVLIDDGANLGRRILQNIINKHKEITVNELESEQDLSHVQSILQVIADDLDEGEEVQVPIKHNNYTLKFLPANKCKYNDSGSFANFLVDEEDEEEDDDLILVHSGLPNDLCRRLGATPLSNAVLDAEEFGQQETLLTRLANILDEYPAGATIFQELIQNADDAGANEIGFLIDMRENAQWRRSVLWKKSGMDKFQGPALWVFNDAIFTEKDFKNILSVGGATKRSESEKIGTFGVGFNSVYHLTDMPSFVSDNFLAILDPHKFCVPNSAGIKFNLLRKPNKLKAFSDQFSPYKDVFKCDISYKREGVTYPHTLFRLPLRDIEMASKSQLSNITHNMEQLLKKFAETRNYITLFLQHIHKLSFQHLERIHSSPLNAQQVLIIEKIVEPIASNLPRQEIFTKVVKRCLSENQFMPLYQSSLVKVKIVNNNNTALNLGISREKDTYGASWIVQWNATGGKAVELASSTEGRAAGLMPAVAVASCMTEDSNKFKVDPISGLVFCYLPLPVESGLPFHVHAPFTFASNRRHLWTENAKDETNLKTQWNEALITNDLVQCLIKLLEVLKNYDEDNRLVDYQFYSLWPCQSQVKSEFSGFVASFYNQLCKTEKCLWKAENGHWILFSQARFLLLTNQWSESFIKAAQEVLQLSLDLHQNDAKFILLSSEVQMTVKSLFSDELMTQSYTDETFFETIFFPNLIDYDSELTNLILLEILTGNDAQKTYKYLKKTLQETCCIPASPDGKCRFRPCDLVDVEGEISKLYTEDDGKFPYGQFREPEIKSKLILLGLRRCPTGEMLVERAKTVSKYVETDCVEKAKILTRLILKYLTDFPDDSFYDQFFNIPFMFALKSEPNWSLPWFDADKILFNPSELFYKTHKNAICFVYPIWDDEGIIPSKAVQLAYHLNVGRNPTVDSILSQLQILSELDMVEFSNTQFKEVQEIAAECLKLLQSYNPNLLQEFLSQLMEINAVIIKSIGAVPYNIVSCEFLEANCAPYLHSIQDTPYEECLQILENCGVKTEFSIDDYIDALKRMKENYGTEELPQTVLQVAIHINNKLHKLLQEDEEDVQNYKLELLVPDSNGVLMPASSLIFWELDMNEIPKDLQLDAHFCNSNIVRDVALSLGIRLQRTMIAELFSVEFFSDEVEAFGQYENLTTRIKSILNEYSNKSDVISEMIQNADDAGATEVRFILDKRQLSTDPKKLLSDNWKDLQGPALIVYNNKPFKTEHYDGIRKLGLGSKRKNAELSGKFGIGFNTVYHLTDVPMFISNGEKLCALDPHCKYVPIATITKPGGLFTINNNFKTLHSDVLPAFQPVEDLNLADSTVFRLPLRHDKQNIPSLIGQSISVEELSQMFHRFEKNAKEYLLFLRNVEKIQVTYVDMMGKISSDSTYYFNMSDEEREKKNDFFKKLSCQTQLDTDAIVEYKLKLFKRSQQKEIHEEWLVLQRLSCLKHDVPSVLTDLINSKVLKALPIVGIATPLSSSSSINKSKIYSTLPLSGHSKCPVHINGKFMLDSGRKHCYLLDDGSHKTEWNKYLIVKVLAPLYVQVLETMKKELCNNWSSVLSCNKTYNFKPLIAKYLNYFPLGENLDKIPLMMLKEVYKIVRDNNLKLFFEMVINKNLRREFLWFSITEGVIDSLEESHPVCSSLKLVNQMSDVDYIRSALEKIYFRKFHCGFNEVVTEIAQDLEMDLKPLSSCLLAQYMKNIDDDKLIIPSTAQKSIQNVPTNAQNDEVIVPFSAQNFPVEMNNVVLNKNEIHHCLKYILKDPNINLNQIPLLLTADDKLRRFSSTYELYKSDYFKLLPSQGEFFCSTEINFTLPERFCQEFTVSSIAEHLHIELPHLYNVERVAADQINTLVWDILDFLADVNYPPHIEAFWDYTSFLIQQIKPLENWALLPVNIRDVQKNILSYLVPLRYAPLTVLTDSLPKELSSVLENLGCMFTNVDYLVKKDTTLPNHFYRNENNIFFKYLCITTKHSTPIVNLLHSVCTNKIEGADFSRISEKKKLILLEYIITNYSSLDQRKVNDVVLIKSLPLFATVKGTFTSLNTVGLSSIISCSGEIEEAELDKLISDKNIVFLTSRLAKEECFCKNMNINVLTPIQVYKNYIIPFMDKFSLKSMIKHLNWIKNNSEHNTELDEQLGAKPLIKTGFGQFKAIKDLYSSEIKQTFEVMMSEENFILQSFWTVLEQMFGQNLKSKLKWKQFFKRLGLRDEIDSNVFLDFAKKLEAQEKLLDDKILMQRSQILAKYLKAESKLHKNENFLQQLSTVKFIYSHKVPDNLEELYEQNAGFRGLICYKDGIVEYREQICWTVCKLLPFWSTIHSTDVDKHLGYYTAPTINHVLQHAENVCHRLQPLKYGELKTEGVNSKESINSLRNVMKAIFKFLIEKDDKLNDNVLKTMKNMPCVLVEDGRKLICPSQVVSDTFIECPPFLYVLPEDMFPFIKVLQKFGTERKISCHHYISALKMVYTMFTNTPIKNPDIKNSLKNIYIGFLNHLIQLGPEKVTDDILYLPDENSCMQKSTDILVFTENPEDFTRSTQIQGHKWNTIMIKNIDIPLIKCADALMHLRPIIRPYQEFVTQVLNVDCEVCDDQDFCEHQYNIKRLFQNILFIRVLVKLINFYEMHLDGNPAKQDEFAVFFKQIEVICYKELKVTQYHRDTNESIKEQTVPVFWRKTQDNVVQFLVTHEEMKDSFTDNLIDLLKSVCPMRSRLHESFMASLLGYVNLASQTNSLKSILKRQLKEYEVKENYLPQLGSVLTEDLISLLNQDCCNHYKVFDYIAYPITNTGKETEKVYIFGLIVKELEKADENKYVKWFLVDIGLAEPVEKSTLEIYKFLNVEEMEDEVKNTMELERHEFPEADETNKKFSRDLEEVLEEVSDQLENFWKLSLEDRGKAVRRLYLYWHPDKNPPDNSKYSTEVFKHVKNELVRLEKGNSRKSKSKKSENGDFPFSKWDKEADNDKNRKENYYKRASSDWEHFSSSTRESGVPPAFAKSFNKTAKLWCEQAKFDLDSAVNEAASSSPSYEWVFYKYYQVARKSMIAMLFTRTTFENQNANLMELALDVARAFGEQYGDICKIVKLMIQNGVDEIRTINPRFGKTPHGNCQQYVNHVQVVDESAKKLFEMAKQTIGEN